MDELVKRIKSKSDIELLKIIEYDFEKYTPETLSIAKKEFALRSLSIEEIDTIRKKLGNIPSTKSNSISPKTIASINTQKKKIINLLNPISPKTHLEYIKLISIFLGLTYLLYLSKQLGLLYYLFIDQYYDLSTLDFIIFLIILPIGIVNFWKIKRTGWQLINGILCYSFISKIIVTINEFNWWLVSSNNENDIESPLFDLINKLTPQFNPVESAIQILLLLLLGLYLNKAELLNIFKINNQDRIITFGVATAISLIVWLGMML